LINIKHRTTTADPEVQTTLFLILGSLFNTPKSVRKQLNPQFEDLAMCLIDTGNQQTQAVIAEVKDIKLSVTKSNQSRDIPSFRKK